MMASLYAGVSGLKNHQVRMNVIGNNIANVNTVGYKTARVNFQEALVQTFKGAGRPNSTSGGTNAVQLGLGMQVAALDNLFLQGGLETTGQITDMAIQGSGFFILADNNGNQFFTRAGAFGFDGNSNLVDPATGLFVQGRMADNSGVIPALATISNITLPFGQQDPAAATTSMQLSRNIDASATESISKLITAGGSNVVGVSGTAVDGVGGTHTINITGSQALFSSFNGANIGNDGTGAPVGALSSSMQLGGLGVTDFSNFGFSVNNGPMQYITGLSATSTVGDLVNQINLITGIKAELIAGEVVITNEKAGSPTDFNFASTTGASTLAGGGGAATGNIVGVIFGQNGTAIASAGGAASTFIATDSFVPDLGYGAAAGPFVTNLGLVLNDSTGLVVGLSGLGNGGVRIDANPNTGLTATAGSPLIVNTTPTQHAMSIVAYDAQGGKHTVSLQFFKSAIPNRWEWSAATNGSEVITGGQFGYVAFNPNGSLNTFEFFGGANAITVDPRNGSSNLNIEIDAGTIGAFDGLTGFASGVHTASIINQNGYGVGILEKIDVDSAGNISGIFSNGVTRLLAQIMLSDVSNQGGLRKAGRSLFQTSPNSGSAISGIAGSTVSGSITSGALESSAVDIAQEFTGMITAQRGFQANARIITTSDDMLDELVNLKR